MLDPRSALDPAGVQATRTADLFWQYFDVSALVFVLVVGAFVIAVVRRGSKDEVNAKRENDRAKERAVIGATAVTIVTLVVLLVLSVVTGHALASLSKEDALQIEVVGHKWWWEVKYPAGVPSDSFTTTYEIHIPVGRAVELHLSSSDVIHSFWAPSLGPKRDLIPGKPTTYFLKADRPGSYDGMCAEYCGLQHANMRFIVIAESDADFQRWLAHQRTPARVPSTEITRAGQDVFMKDRCFACHAMTGTDAYATVGPDLTHVASRRRLGMGTIVNDDKHLAEWIADPHASKPGVAMPGTPLSPDDQRSLVAYLRSLE